MRTRRSSWDSRPLPWGRRALRGACCRMWGAALPGGSRQSGGRRRTGPRGRGCLTSLRRSRRTIWPLLTTRRRATANPQAAPCHPGNPWRSGSTPLRPNQSFKPLVHVRRHLQSRFRQQGPRYHRLQSRQVPRLSPGHSQRTPLQPCLGFRRSRTAAPRANPIKGQKIRVKRRLQLPRGGLCRKTLCHLCLRASPQLTSRSQRPYLPTPSSLHLHPRKSQRV
mmetsp:Transcript_1472/g.3528  ORF Transcript_1472/g.3528 Transcript_1472/m.3528 type:complete len:222 (+) Transcript_1472:1371-2036(+)